MNCKTFEIRDSATFVPACGILLAPKGMGVTEADVYLMHRQGWRSEMGVLFGRMNGGKWCADPYDWGDRTMQVAHHYILEHWFELLSGSVIDVEFILKETERPKQSEAVEEHYDRIAAVVGCACPSVACPIHGLSASGGW